MRTIWPHWPVPPVSRKFTFSLPLQPGRPAHERALATGTSGTGTVFAPADHSIGSLAADPFWPTPPPAEAKRGEIFHLAGRLKLRAAAAAAAARSERLKLPICMAEPSLAECQA